MEIKKVVIPAAGWGTRFLPATKAMPKEMLPVVDKPVIQYVVEEAIAAGIDNIILITGWQKRAIEDHFDRSLELEKHLKSQGKEEALKVIKEIAEMANFIYIRQKGELYGNAIPILAAQPAIGNEPFAVMWGDEFITANPPRLVQMLKAYEKYQDGAMISAVRIEDRDQLSRYGIADVEKVDDGIFRIKSIVEKPSPQEAPSNLATHGAYILPPEIFDVIKFLTPYKGEYYLPQAINELNKKGIPIYACEIKNGKYYDTGNKLEYLKTVVEFALSRPEFAEGLKKYLKELQL